MIIGESPLDYFVNKLESIIEIKIVYCELDNCQCISIGVLYTKGKQICCTIIIENERGIKSEENGCLQDKSNVRQNNRSPLFCGPLDL